MPLWFDAELKDWADQGLTRRIQTPSRRWGRWLEHGRRTLLNLSSNDVLGLAGDEALNRRFLTQLLEGPAEAGLFLGSTASRLMTGAFGVQQELESALEEFFPGRRVLLFNSGYHANTGLLPALAGPGDAIFADRWNHASLIDGMRLSGARFFRYRHADAAHLEELLIQHRGQFRRAWIVTESVFSMDGDVPDLAALASLRDRFDASLFVDEAHAFGSRGPHGAGMAAQFGVVPDVLVGTLGKALASQGAFAVANESLIDYAVQKARTFIYSTAIPPISTAWVLWLLRQPELLEGRRRALTELASNFRAALAHAGIASTTEGFLFPVVYGSPEATHSAFERCLSAGYWTLPVRPPTVPDGTCRLRLSLRADIEFSELQALIPALREGAAS